MSVEDVLLLVSIVATGLMAGLFYGWVVSVIPGTAKLDDAMYVTLMRHINREILTPRFLAVFVGIPLLVAAAAVAQFRGGDQRRGVIVAVAGATYLLGVFGVTAAGNVPLNDALERFDPDGASSEEIERQRRAYEGRWNRWNAVRTAANVGAFALLTVAAVIDDDA